MTQRSQQGVEPAELPRPGIRTGGHTSRAHNVYEALRHAIQKGRYRGGERIREEEVARSLGVSRTPVREALSRLQAQGLLEFVAGGLAVSTLSRSQIIELYDVRGTLEGLAARLSAQHASPSEIAFLKRMAQMFEEGHDDPVRMARVNRELHAAIYESAHNRYLIRTLDGFHDWLSLLPGTTFTVPGRPDKATVEHWQIVSAIESRDADAAERFARHHMRMAQVARLEMLITD